MKTFRLLFVALTSLLLAPHGHAEAWSTAVLSISEARLVHADGTTYVVPILQRSYSTSAAAFTRLGEEQFVDFGDDSSSWSASSCLGDCGNFPPEDTQVRPGGYANADSWGYMAIGSENPVFAQVRADVAATDTQPALAGASAANQFRFIAETSEPVTLVFDATPYVNQYLAAGTPQGSTVSAALALTVRLFNVTTQQEIFSSAPDLVNRTFELSAAPGGASFIFEPEPMPFAYAIGDLVMGNAYELTIAARGAANVLLTVPEPAGAGLYLAGLMVLGLAGLRRSRIMRKWKPADRFRRAGGSA